MIGSTMSASRELYCDEYLHVLLEQGGTLVRVVRSARAFRDTATIERVFSAVYSALGALELKDCGLLADQRLAPGRNEPEFEQALARSRNQIYPLFQKRAVLVRSAIGKLQLSRLIKQDQYERLVSQDEAELLRYLGY